ncbi:MAG: DUF1573 domain-containing protein [Bacteroidia bacterium]|nr:DUF1573 domain-containing protein [Bacteroidia bacterium]MDW8333270.1 DUF1573 domain-containing protein [Bacteroidia bacterium]
MKHGFWRTWALVASAALVACAGEKKESENNSQSAVSDTASAVVAKTDSTAASDTALAKTTIAFEKTKHDFGVIAEGDSAVYDFVFTNTGKNPLKITKVKPACGCTTPSYTKDPVAPGEKGYVRVKFDSNGRPGKANKDVTVFANTDPPATKLTFTAEVTPKAKK